MRIRSRSSDATSSRPTLAALILCLFLGLPACSVDSGLTPSPGENRLAAEPADSNTEAPEIMELREVAHTVAIRVHSLLVEMHETGSASLVGNRLNDDIIFGTVPERGEGEFDVSLHRRTLPNPASDGDYPSLDVAILDTSGYTIRYRYVTEGAPISQMGADEVTIDSFVDALNSLELRLTITTSYGTPDNPNSLTNCVTGSRRSYCEVFDGSDPGGRPVEVPLADGTATLISAMERGIQAVEERYR